MTVRGVIPFPPSLSSVEAASRMARVCALGIAFDELLPETLREAAALCAADGALLAIFPPGVGAVLPEEVLAWPPGDPGAALLPSPPRRWEEVLPPLRRGEALLLGDMRALPPDDPWRLLLAGIEGTVSALLHPLRIGSTLHGVLLLRSSVPGRLGEAVLPPLSMAASVLAAALERRSMERRLAASEERYRFLAEHSLDFITLHEAGGEGACLYASPVSARLLGVSADAYRRASRHAFVPAEDGERLREGERRLASGEEGSVTVQHRMRRADGSFVEVESVLSLLPPGGGSPPRLLRVTRDVTARREMERSLFESRRLEAVGFLAGGVAHEFNNLLAGIQGSAEILSLLLRRRDPGDEGMRHLETIDRMARRAAAITSQLLAYARRGAFTPAPVSVNRVVAETLPLLRGALPDAVEVRTLLSRDLPPVQADYTLLRQVMTNLCVNAAEALPGGGTVTVRTRLLPEGTVREPAGAGWATCRHGAVPPGDRVLLEVEDRGCGMDGETLERIFDPFFSTKFVGRGLGLAAVLGIVESHGGSIEVSSCAGAGTVVAVSLPTTAAEGAPPSSPTVAVPPASSLPRRVLLADDEEDVRQVLGALVASLGYEAVEARDGKEALEIFRSRPDDFGVVLLDLMMPGLTGDKAFAAMRALRPGQKGILSSGYDESGRAGRHAAEGFSGFLQKPFRRGDLKRRLEEILEPPPTQ